MSAQAPQSLTVSEVALQLSRAWRTGGMTIDGNEFLGAVAAVDEAICRAHGAEPAKGVVTADARDERISRIARATIARHAASPLTSTPECGETIVATVLDEADRPHPRAR